MTEIISEHSDRNAAVHKRVAAQLSAALRDIDRLGIESSHSEAHMLFVPLVHSVSEGKERELTSVALHILQNRIGLLQSLFNAVDI